MSDKINTKPRLVRCPKCLNVLPEPPEVLVYKCGGCNATLQAKKRNINLVNTTSHKPDDDRIQEAGSSSNQQFPVKSTDDSHRNGDHDAANILKKGSFDAPKQKLKQISDNHDEPHQIFQNDPRSSTELSGHEDSESSPEATCHIGINQEITQNTKREITDLDRLSDNKETRGSFNQQLIVNSNSFENLDPESSPDAIVDSRINQDYNNNDDFNDDDDDVFLSCRHETDFEDSGSEYGGGSKSSFKSSTAKKTLDAKHKKPMYQLDISSKTEHFGGYESGVSSSNNRAGKVKHRSMDVRSYYGLNEFHEPRRHRSHMISENPKLERLELLKKVKELQNQLERTNISNHYGHRMAFSGETTAVNRRLDGGTCHHCYPQDRRFSAQLPRPHVCCNGPRYTSRSGPYYTPRVSIPPSPIHNRTESEFSEFSAPEYRRRNDVNHSPKRYIRPVANGSPWIACYRCLSLLELPQSFLVFHKRNHSLRCGACMRVLNFTLSNGAHITRYYPEETLTAPPSSEVEDGSRAGPVSCTDSSFQKSYSTETDRNFWEFSEERRNGTMSRDPSGSKVSGRRKMASEIEGVRGPNGSPLHQLMGYASPSKVIRGSDGGKF